LDWIGLDWIGFIHIFPHASILHVILPLIKPFNYTHQTDRHTDRWTMLCADICSNSAHLVLLAVKAVMVNDNIIK